jgi:hypothetical protein
MDVFTGDCPCGNGRIVASGPRYRVGMCHWLRRKHHGALSRLCGVPSGDADLGWRSGDLTRLPPARASRRSPIGVPRGVAARLWRATRAAAALTVAVVFAWPAATVTAQRQAAPDAALRLDPRAGGGVIASHFVGFSIEWSLIERYMGPSARPAFASLLRNLGTGELRIGGGTQDLMPFDPGAANSVRVITPEDVRAVRATLDAVNGEDRGRTVPAWGAILGTALAPKGDERRPFVSPEHARAFATQGVAPAFAGAERYVAGIGLGNEPDITYRYDVARYLADFAVYRDAGVTEPFALIAPSLSEPVAPWQAIEARSVPTRLFWEWPAILDAIAPAVSARRSVHGTFATDHFYPLARGCVSDPYRCGTIERLLSDERFGNLAYQVFLHGSEAARHGLAYRLQEINSAAGRGVDGVSNVAAAALWTLAMMFESACPQPPNAPGANADCSIGSIGVNLHNAEVNAWFVPEEGNAFYNAIAYDPSPAVGPPTAAPPYYALLLFARFAQGTSGLRPLAVSADSPAGARIKAWQVDAGARGRRLFVLNMSGAPATATVAAPASRYTINRLTPHDPTGPGRTLDAPQVRIDGRAVRPDGSWPGFAPTRGALADGRLRLELGGGEAAVVTLGG